MKFIAKINKEDIIDLMKAELNIPININVEDITFDNKKKEVRITFNRE